MQTLEISHDVDKIELTPKPQNPVESLMREVIDMNSKVILDNYKDIIKLYTQYGDDFLIHC